MGGPQKQLLPDAQKAGKMGRDMRRTACPYRRIPTAVQCETSGRGSCSRAMPGSSRRRFRERTDADPGNGNATLTETSRSDRGV